MRIQRRHLPDRMFAFDGGHGPGQVSHAVLLGLGRTIERHPAVRHASGKSPGRPIRIVATLDPAILGMGADGSGVSAGHRCV